MNIPTGPDEVLLRAIAQDPKRLSELAGIEPSWIVDEVARLGIEAAFTHHRRAGEQGLLRFATRAAIEREARDLIHARKQDDKRSDELRRGLASVLDSSASGDRVDEHAFREAIDQVREAAMDEMAREGLIRIVDGFRRGGRRATGVAAELRELSSRIQEGEPRGSLVGRLGDEATLVIRDYVRAKKTPGAGYIATPFPRLNELTGGGGRAGRMWMMAAYAKCGKTQGAKELVHRAGLAGLGSLVVTAEQTKSDVRSMIVARHSHAFIAGGLDMRRLATGKLSRPEERALQETVKDIAAGGLGPISYFQAPSGTTVGGDIRSLVEATARKHPVDVLMLDHSLLFHPERRQESEVGRVSEVIREAKQLSLDANGGKGLWVILCHQISRKGKEEADKRGGFHLPRDLAETAEAERSADLVLWFWRDEALIDVAEIRMGIAVDRYGPGDVRGWNAYERFTHAAVLPIEEELKP